MNDHAPIDADGHVMETDEDLRRYLPPPPGLKAGAR